MLTLVYTEKPRVYSNRAQEITTENKIGLKKRNEEIQFSRNKLYESLEKLKKRMVSSV